MVVGADFKGHVGERDRGDEEVMGGFQEKEPGRTDDGEF